MKTTKKLSVIIAVILITASLFAAAAPSANALVYSCSSSYKSGQYYTKLTNVTLTGNMRTDIVNVAKSQIGYTEGNNSSQLAGTSGGSGNYTEYGRWYGSHDMWCAMFVSWCAYVAGVPESIVLKHAYTPTGLSWFQNKGQAYSRASVANGAYTPKAGDIVYFKSSRNSNPTNHIGIVTGYSGGTLSTVEGNADDKVKACSYSITNTYIVYICSPNYTNAQNENFVSHLDDYSAITGGVKIKGWCYDKRITGTALQVHVYLGGPAGSANVEANPFNVADKPRTDVDDAYHCGANHGFEAEIPTSKTGSVPVYVYAVNPNNGESALISNFVAEIAAPKPDNFQTCLDGYSAVVGGVKISGWCYDKRSPDTTLEVHVYFGGPAGSANAEGNPFNVADKPRTDVDAAHHCGANHGFDAEVSTGKTGSVPVYVYAVNPNNGESALIDNFVAEITAPEPDKFQTWLDEHVAVPGGVTISGWCYDKRSPDTTLEVHVYFGGQIGTAGAERVTGTVANGLRTDVDAAYGCGSNHGFRATVYTTKTGAIPVYVYAVNPDNGESSLISSFTADIQAPSGEPKLLGDINDDGKINNKDVVALFRYVSSNGTGADLSVYDVNNDGKINNKDVVALFRLAMTN